MLKVKETKNLCNKVCNVTSIYLCVSRKKSCRVDEEVQRVNYNRCNGKWKYSSEEQSQIKKENPRQRYPLKEEFRGGNDKDVNEEGGNQTPPRFPVTLWLATGRNDFCRAPGLSPIVTCPLNPSNPNTKYSILRGNLSDNAGTNNTPYYIIQSTTKGSWNKILSLVFVSFSSDFQLFCEKLIFNLFVDENLEKINHGNFCPPLVQLLFRTGEVRHRSIKSATRVPSD